MTGTALALAMCAFAASAAVVHADPAAPVAISSRFGGVVDVVSDVELRGAAVMVGGAVDVTDDVEAQVGAMLGPTFGGYLGGQYYVTRGSLRPLFAAGAPIFFLSGPRVGLRGAVGIEWRATPHLAVTAQLGLEHYFNANGDIADTTLTPIVGVTGRL